MGELPPVPAIISAMTLGGHHRTRELNQWPAASVSSGGLAEQMPFFGPMQVSCGMKRFLDMCRAPLFVLPSR